MTKTTYKRKALDRTRRGTCPCCLKRHNCLKGGGMTRHGWKEQGRRAGEWGCGFQWGECWGTGMRPLEETDASALVVIERLNAEIEDRTTELATHEGEGRETYTWEHEVGKSSYNNYWEVRRMDAIAEMLKGNTEVDMDTAFTIATLDIVVEDKEIRRKDKYHRCNIVTLNIREYTAQVPRGFEGGTASTVSDWDADTATAYFGPVVPHHRTDVEHVTICAHETMRKQKVCLLESHIKATKNTRDAVTKAVAHHKENPSWGIPHTAGGKKTVHYYWTGRSERNHIGCNRRENWRPYMTKTEAEVTCSRCEKYIAKRDIERAKRAKRAEREAVK